MLLESECFTLATKELDLCSYIFLYLYIYIYIYTHEIHYRCHPKCSQTQNCVENQSNKMQHSKNIYILGVKIKSKTGVRGRINNITKYSRRHLSYFTRPDCVALSTGRRPLFPFSVDSFSRPQIESRRVFRERIPLTGKNAALCLPTCVFSGACGCLYEVYAEILSTIFPHPDVTGPYLKLA